MNTYEKAKKTAASIVGYRMYTCNEVEDKLRRKGFEAEIAEQVVSEFAAAGILDDRAYAEAYVQDAVNLGGKGVYRIRQELYKKGVAPSIIDAACCDIREQTCDALREYVESRNLCSGITSRYELEKLKARLARRGFSPSEIREVLSEYKFDFED